MSTKRKAADNEAAPESAAVASASSVTPANGSASYADEIPAGKPTSGRTWKGPQKKYAFPFISSHQKLTRTTQKLSLNISIIFLNF